MVTAHTVRIADVVDRSPFSPRQVSVIAILISLAIIDGFDAQTIGFVIPALSKSWQVTAAVFGVLLVIKAAAAVAGAVLMGMFGDRFGRRPAILLSLAVISVFTLLSATAHTLGMLTAWQALASFGVGGILPGCIALASEFTPARNRNICVTLIGASAALGGFIGALLSAAVLPHIGASGVFLIGGISAIVIGAVTFRWLPESAQFTLSLGQHDRALAIVRRIVTRSGLETDTQLEPPPAVRADLAPAAEIFARGLRARTGLVWILFFVTYLIGYLVISWMPSIFGAAGVSSSNSLVAIACFNIGGFIGGILIGAASDRTGQPFLVLVAGYVVAAIGTSLVAAALQSPGSLWIVCGMVGLGVGGAYGAIASVASQIYPVRARSTGVGWAYGVGRIGSIIGPGVGGIVLGAGLGAGAIFSSLLVPLTLAVLALLMLWRLQRHRTPVEAPAVARAEKLDGQGVATPSSP